MRSLNTGFSEINEERLAYHGAAPWFLEVAITGSCNFSCKYCNRFATELDVQAFKTWLADNQLRHIQITGGEPTVRTDFLDIVKLCRDHTRTVGLSTNASWGIDRYLSLPVDMYSISLDDYDHDILVSRGYQNPKQVEETVRALAHAKYVNVGMVIDELNADRAEEIIDYILSLGVRDVKLSVSTKAMSLMPRFTKAYAGYPILSYRVRNFMAGKPMRGYSAKRCGIMASDVTIVGDKHYPCLVYFREKGQAVGKVTDKTMMADRLTWAESHDCHADPICARYCMDFKCDFNLALESLAHS
jgi:MoaA/NifB/PqqE/SkfB family radical SAM enzyme